MSPETESRARQTFGVQRCVRRAAGQRNGQASTMIVPQNGHDAPEGRAFRGLEHHSQ